MKITVIMVALNEAPFIGTAIAAVYPFVHRIFVQTGYDRSWNDQPVVPDGTVETVLGLPDPDGKLALLVRRIPDEAIARNLLMRTDHYTLDHRHRNTVGMHDKIDPFCDRADYFWVIDGDEIYDPRTIEPILAYLRERKPKALYIRGLTYFRSWNYVVHPSDNFFQPGFLRPGLVFQENRKPVSSRLWRLAFNKYTRRLPIAQQWSAMTLVGWLRLPEEIGVFHHGSYVGDDARILKKIRLSVHYEEKMDAWYRDVWLKWTPAMKNLHPIYPPDFAAVKHVPTPELPPIIREQRWPDSYIER